ncbi:sugar-transfer associated ATP-grasp domain-containing protein [Halopiger aswanensis]|uniref:sugar-transfer associated ATP-grasp domain-containing protein n=1 Tax=Halopiger aswanensis TaxID=148449 RepID=UPI000E71D9E6|nr:sugar-transfer associated ATP-grasp domain-containing protein [Halopiger aswanensis]
MNVRQLYHTIRGVQDLAATERESTVSRSLRRRCWLWRRGFLSRSDAVYDLDESTYRDYVSDYQRYVRSKRINGTWSVALSNKLLFHRVMQPFDAHRMAVYGMLRDGTYHPIDDRVDGPAAGSAARHELADGGPALEAVSGTISGTESDRTEGRRERDAPHTTRNAAQRVVERLEAEERLVLKWVRGGGGNNVLLCTRTEDGYRVNGDQYAEVEFRSLVSNLDEYLVCEYVEQGPFGAALYPETPNTLRIITMYDEAAGEPFIAAAIHRIGTSDSAPLDNFTQGGLSAAIDPDSGTLSAGAQPPVDGEVEWHSRHPDTGVPIDGAQVPGWHRIRERLLEIAAGCSFVPYVGWDVIVTDEDGSFTVIEANSYPGLKSIQVHGPLLADDRVRRFYERHGVR